MLNEYFVPVNGFEGIYSVSNKGQVYSHRSNKLIKPWLGTRGNYLRIVLTVLGKKTRYSIHRLVALHFVPGYREGLVVNHIDEDSLNNNPTNLQWVTQKENMLHSQEKIQAAARKGRTARWGVAP